MAVITCGSNGSTGQQIADQINTNTTDIATLQGLPISHVFTSAPLVAQPLTATPTPIVFGDSLSVIRVGIPITSYSKFTFANAGYYEVQFNLSISSANGEEISFGGLINGVTYSPAKVYVTCSGVGKPIPVSWSTILNASANDELEIVATSIDGSASLVIEASSVFVRKV